MPIKAQISAENSILSLYISFNRSLKDFKYKTAEQHFQNVPFSSDWPCTLHESLMHPLVELPRKV